MTVSGRIFAVGAVIVALAAAAGGAQAAGTTVWDGAFSKAQSKRGEALYVTNCASCHMEDLSGKSPAPELAGDTFMSHWDTHSVGDLYTKVRTTMPQNRPAVLPEQDYLDIVAFLLDANGFPDGKADLKVDQAALKAIAITGQKPK